MRQSQPNPTGNNHDRGVADPPSQGLPSAETDHNVTYHINNNREMPKGWTALVDRGANGGIAGQDTRVLATMDRSIDLSGIDDHTVRNLPLVTAGGVVRSNRGDIILIMNQYAHMADGKTIHSSGQMEWYSLEVQDKTKKATGDMPYIKTLEGYVIPLAVRNGLAYMQMRAPTNDELRKLVHVTITEDRDWNPSVLDSRVPDEWKPYHQSLRSSESNPSTTMKVN